MSAEVDFHSGINQGVAPVTYGQGERPPELPLCNAIRNLLTDDAPNRRRRRAGRQPVGVRRFGDSPDTGPLPEAEQVADPRPTGRGKEGVRQAESKDVALDGNLGRSSGGWVHPFVVWWLRESL